MSFRSYRWVWNQFARAKCVYKTTQYRQKGRYYRQDCTAPCTVGFSLFTWLGFNQKLSAEDELINTIKHCVLFIRNNDFERAEQLLHVALRQAQQIQHELGITYIYDVMANLALQREQYDKAKQLFVAVTQRLMANGAQQEDPRVVHISIKLARVSHMKKEYEVAQLGYDWCLQQLENILKKSPDVGTKQLLALAQDWYGRMFLECNQYDHGVKLLIKALDTMKEVPEIETEQIAIQMNDIGTVLLELGRTDESLDFIKGAIKVCEGLKGFEDLGAIYVNLGRVYMSKNLMDEARKSCGYALRLGHESKNEDVKKEANLCMKQVMAATA